MDNKIEIRGRNLKSVFSYLQYNSFSDIADYRKAFEDFKTTNGHYPTVQDIDKSNYIPSSRTIQRKFGGIKTLRKLIGLADEDIDQRSGTQRLSRITEMGERSFENENEIYKKLCTKYGEKNVHRQSPYNNDRIFRTDFKVYLPDGTKKCIDVFYPADRISLLGCINSKQKKVEQLETNDIIYFVVMNKEITQQMINTIIEHKKNKLHSNVIITTYDNLIKVL